MENKYFILNSNFHKSFDHNPQTKPAAQTFTL